MTKSSLECLPTELIGLVKHHLDSRSISNLRLSSQILAHRAVQQTLSHCRRPTTVRFETKHLEDFWKVLTGGHFTGWERWLRLECRIRIFEDGYMIYDKSDRKSALLQAVLGALANLESVDRTLRLEVVFACEDRRCSGIIYDKRRRRIDGLTHDELIRQCLRRLRDAVASSGLQLSKLNILNEINGHSFVRVDDVDVVSDMIKPGLKELSMVLTGSAVQSESDLLEEDIENLCRCFGSASSLEELNLHWISARSRLSHFISVHEPDSQQMELFNRSFEESRTLVSRVLQCQLVSLHTIWLKGFYSIAETDLLGMLTRSTGHLHIKLEQITMSTGNFDSIFEYLNAHSGRDKGQFSYQFKDLVDHAWIKFLPDNVDESVDAKSVPDEEYLRSTVYSRDESKEHAWTPIRYRRTPFGTASLSWNNQLTTIDALHPTSA